MKNHGYISLAAATLPLMAWAAGSNPDSDFYKKAAEGGLSEVELGQLAQQKAASPDVKQFAQMMIDDHSSANMKLQKLAATKDISLPTSSSVGQMATKTKLKVLSGDTFDKSYVKSMISDHKEDIAEFRKEAQSGQDPDARAFAKATLPTLEKHLQSIEALAPNVGVKDM
jgi:putative membrane protein